MLSGVCVRVCCLNRVKMLSGRLISSNCVYGPLREGLADRQECERERERESERREKKKKQKAYLYMNVCVRQPTEK